MLNFVMNTMTPDMMRRFWALVNELSRPEVVQRQDDDLIRLLLRECQEKPPLSNVDSQALNTYISQHLPLIRDLVLE
jgi:hypothetical protein